MVSKKKSAKNVGNVNQKTSIIQEDNVYGQQCKIALAAYYKAEKRGFAPGQELNDWFEAEHDIMGNPY